MFPKMGTTVPKLHSRGDTTVTYAKGVGAAIRRELGDSRHATKTLMRWTNASERSIKNWLAARKGPRGDNLIQLIRHSDEVLKEVLRLANRDENETLGDFAIIRSILIKTAERIDTLVSQETTKENRNRSAELATKESITEPTNDPNRTSDDTRRPGTVLEFDVLKLNTLDKVLRAFNSSDLNPR